MEAETHYTRRREAETHYTQDINSESITPGKFIQKPLHAQTRSQGLKIEWACQNDNRAHGNLTCTEAKIMGHEENTHF